MPSNPLTARCYCGSVTFDFEEEPQVISYCHCGDCKRWTGSPLPAFVAFASSAVDAELPPAVSHAPGVSRRNCATCGSPLTAEFDYLPGQIYVPLGLFDDASTLRPSCHSHAEGELAWLKLGDALPRHAASARHVLSAENR